MAEPLHAAIGDNSVDIGMALDFHDRYDDADRRVAEAVAARKDLRAAVKAAGIRLAGFDRARRDRTRSGAEREADNAEYERQMRWLGKPVGTQAGFNFDANDFDLDGIDSEGERAGFAGKRRESNPWTPRTEAADRWDEGWLRGDAQRQDAEPEEEEEEEAPPQRRRGRPLGSKNRPKLVAAQ
jgi:ribosome modulation factor